MANERDRETIPAPAEPDLRDLLGELKAHLERTSELCVKVANRLTLLEIAELTAEHRINVHADRINDHEERLRKLEGLDPTPAAPAAPPTAAE